LQASRAADDAFGVSLQEVRVLDVVEASISAVLTRYSISRERIAIDVDGELTLRTDATALGVVLRNLIDNAVKYSDDVPSVHVSARATGSVVRLEVRDEGIGIPRADLKRVFHRFF